MRQALRDIGRAGPAVINVFQFRLPDERPEHSAWAAVTIGLADDLISRRHFLSAVPCARPVRMGRAD